MSVKIYFKRLLKFENEILPPIFHTRIIIISEMILILILNGLPKNN